MSLSSLTIDGTHTTLSDETMTAFRQSFAGPLLFPGDPTYDTVRAIWNKMYDRKPALIARCTGVADVIDAVNFARNNRLLFTVRGGGHHVAGFAVQDDALMIDLSLMKGIHVDPKNCIARAQPGVTLAELDRETQAFGLATPLGVVSETGIAGLTLGGGMGWLRRKYGLACDNLIGADIVTADGEFRHLSAEENSDLFWGIRGGGGNFGIVTSFEYKLHPVGPIVMSATTLYALADAKQVLSAWRDFMQKAADEVTSVAFFWSIPSIEPIPSSMWGMPVVGVGAVYAGDAAEGERVLQPLRQLATPVLDLSGQMPFCMVQKSFDPFFPKGVHFYYNKSTDLKRLDDEVLDALISRAHEKPTSPSILVLWLYGGAMSRVPVSATAFRGRDVPMLYSIDLVWDNPADSEPYMAWARAYIKALQPYSAGGLYTNFASDPEAAAAAFGANHQRLVELKNKYDPQNFFRMNQNIKPTV
ncbi:MAG: FAD-binding oxidoreductase [Caldilineaceae bacterium]